MKIELTEEEVAYLVGTVQEDKQAVESYMFRKWQENLTTEQKADVQKEYDLIQVVLGKLGAE